MTIPPPRNANEFIEQQLDTRLNSLESLFRSDVIALKSGLVVGVDGVIRDVVEEKHAKSKAHALTVVLTTGGGYIEVVQRIVETLRHHYDQVVFVVPDYALSAGTVLAMSGDAIYMDYYSRLGPIDPQVETTSGRRVPALGYLVQWERLLQKANNGTLTLAEMQLMIEGFDQAELYQYEQARDLSIELLKEWLMKYKFKNWIVTETRQKKVTPRMRQQRAEQIARELNRTDRWHSHGYGISMDILHRDLKLRIDDYGADATLSDGIKQYYRLFEDYMAKRDHEAALHTTGVYLPII